MHNWKVEVLSFLGSWEYLFSFFVILCIPLDLIAVLSLPV